VKLVLAAALVVVVGCGDSHRDELARNRNFDCRDRAASYVVVGSLVASELGVMVDCRDQGPRIVRWTSTDAGNRVEQAASLTVGDFERLWDKIEGAGWKYLKDCDGTGAAGDPMYTFDVVDWNGQASFACTHGGPLPFPYHIIVDELDLSAAQHAPKTARGARTSDDP